MDTEGGPSAVTVVLQEKKKKKTAKPAMSGEKSKLLKVEELTFNTASKPELGCLFGKKQQL